MVLDLIKNVSGIVGEVVRRVLPAEKISEQDRLTIESEAKRTATELLLQEDNALRSFFLEYEGRAADMPKSIQILRASVRPILTYVFGATTIYLFWKGVEVPTSLYQMDLIIMVFWFGERAVRNYLETKNGIKSKNGNGE
ncbi:MAG: hypothetical protein AMQ22_00192 [Candidatus Methanofastidiosum methylothiophilum]|uniref:Uncharacterized protein n=1 Tax=Candidatus Methanofastidiosum methylothiophilum TaxID=1705564 RepID=A0A150IT91_9EURY|nr:MAG: hypothetical protein APG11_00849 [Candidatus Methanofastidiosum methylthiophilus]KYC53521.1 MAG: hypothetical protein AMQ22_00192 [Candidatus Methanofastidiosum methylthiophilus]